MDETKKRILQVAGELDSIGADTHEAGRSVREGKVSPRASALMFEGLEHRIRKAINMVHGLDRD
jgi:hypothetical protein